MQIKFVYDSSVQNAPAGFIPGLIAAANIIDSVILNPITINIDIGYGEDQGAKLANGTLGEGQPAFGVLLSYNQLVANLSRAATSADDTTLLSTLPATDPSNGAEFFVSVAQAITWGVRPGSSTEIEGYVGFSSTLPFDYDPSNGISSGTYDFVGSALHELTHTLGRYVDRDYLTPESLLGYSSPGVLDTISNSPRYFSIDGGKTSLGYLDTLTDPADFAANGLPDPFNASIQSGKTTTWTDLDTRMMDVLGYRTTGATLLGSNNIITVPYGTDVIIGYGGIDTAILPDLIKQVTVSGSPTTFATVAGPDISDSLMFVERLQFVDGTLYYDVTSPAAQIERMYQAALGRAPDPTGLANWVAALKAGVPMAQIGASLIGSPEFQIRFPGVSQNAIGFVTQLYANALHRTPDSAGLSAWVGTLQTGAQTQAQVLTGFSESLESQNNTAGSLTNGIWVSDEQAASVARLYYSALGRVPDAGGLIFWTNLLKSGGQTLQQEADGFAGSAEFQQKYGNLTNDDFVSLLYRNVLGRQADSGGLAAWTNTLNTGSLTRSGVLVGFSESQEHQILLAPRIEASGVILG